MTAATAALSGPKLYFPWICDAIAIIAPPQIGRGAQEKVALRRSEGPEAVQFHAETNAALIAKATASVIPRTCNFP